MLRHWSTVLISFSILFAGSYRASSQETTQAPANDGFRSIFDGKTLDGWEGEGKRWTVVDGTIVGTNTADDPLKKNTFLIWNEEVSDFELQLKIKIVGGNTGIQFRSQRLTPDSYHIGGYQADFDAAGKWIGILYDEAGRGILATRGQKVTIGDDAKPVVTGNLATEQKLLESINKEDWNDYRIVAVGNHIQQFINGIQTIDVIDNDSKNRDMEGLLALQLHQGPPMTVSFKDVRIKKITQPNANEDSSNTKLNDRAKVVFVAGSPSHQYGAHEHYAGSVLLAKRLVTAHPHIEAEVTRYGWPADNEVLNDADAVVIYADGGKNHPALPHLDELGKLMDQGVGLVCLHYGVEVPKGPGGEAFVDWIGGYFETNWSVNPHWEADIVSLPEHPITRGVKPFKLNDEWYYHMRFRDNMETVTPILTAIPPESTLKRPDGSHSGNPHVRKAVAEQRPQHIAWCAERADGGRGFGLTGGHFHENWGNDNLRRLVLNAIAWSAKMEVPMGGIDNQNVDAAELELNQDYPKPKKKAS